LRVVDYTFFTAKAAKSAKKSNFNYCGISEHNVECGGLPPLL